jgi:5-methylcytosine-specific restriction endonuclease McrA
MKELDFETAQEFVSEDADRIAYSGPEDVHEYEDYDNCVAPIVVDERKYFLPETGEQRTLKATLYGHTERARRLGRPGEIEPADWVKWCAAFGHYCAYCGSGVPWPVVEHVIPLSRGGDNTIFNVVPACERCNSTKHARRPADWLDTLGLDAFFARVAAALEAMKRKRPES